MPRKDKKSPLEMVKSEPDQGNHDQGNHNKGNHNKLKQDEKIVAKYEDNLTIVGIGASAGGIEALKEFFQAMPAEPGFAIIVVIHTTNTNSTALAQALQSFTNLPVMPIEQGMEVEANIVYVIPPSQEMAITDNIFHLFDSQKSFDSSYPIDFFFRTLAAEKGPRAIGILLSGSNNDGSLGIKEIKGNGGLTIAQDPRSCKYAAMPKNAIVSGFVDLVLAPSLMADEVINFIRHPYLDNGNKKHAGPTNEELEKVLMVIRLKLGHDFAQYKKSTIWRRIQRRMALHHIDELEAYLAFLEKYPAEVDDLFKELLIGVTNFFRDPQAFEALKKEVLPSLFEGKKPSSIVRIWVAACSTGEEAYSLAMLCWEHLQKTNQKVQVQIFATDIDQEAIEAARLGLYPESIAADVSPDRLERFFTHKGNAYQINKNIRDMIVFASQSLIKDPPFSRIDLVSCRNLMIYLDSALQKKIIQIFHYVLNKDGYLFLGSSETIGEHGNLFSIVNKRWKLYKRKEQAFASYMDFPRLPLTHEEINSHSTALTKNKSDASSTELIVKLLFDSYVPPCVIINQEYEIVHFFGRTSPFLEPPIGEATLNILKMAREDLRLELRALIHRVMRENTKITVEQVRLKSADGNSTFINLIVRPLNELAISSRYLLVIFQEIKDPQLLVLSKSQDGNAEITSKAATLERELEHTRETLQTTIEELETSNEELKCTNEELQSSNEELQSTNEELETSKEELQSINEELLTVNSELQSKLEELSLANNDLHNLLSSTETATIFLDNQLLIKRFTPSMTKIFNLIHGDIGRPINHVVNNLVYEDLTSDIETVLRTLVFKEVEVSNKSDQYYKVRIMPYRTVDNRIDGVVITFVDSTELNRHRLKASAALTYAERLFEFKDEALLLLNRNAKVLSANESWQQLFHLRLPELVNKSLYEIDHQRWSLAPLKELLETRLNQPEQVEKVILTELKLELKAVSLKLPAPVMGESDPILLACHLIKS